MLGGDLNGHVCKHAVSYTGVHTEHRYHITKKKVLQFLAFEDTLTS